MRAAQRGFGGGGGGGVVTRSGHQREAGPQGEVTQARSSCRVAREGNEKS